MSKSTTTNRTPSDVAIVEAQRAIIDHLRSQLEAVEADRDKWIDHCQDFAVANKWLLAENERLRATIARVEALPEKWLNENGDYSESKRDCADELTAAINPPAGQPSSPAQPAD